MTGLVKAVIEMSNRIQPAAPEEYVPMVKVGSVFSLRIRINYCDLHCHFSFGELVKDPSSSIVFFLKAKTCVCLSAGGWFGAEDPAGDSG